MNKEVVEHDPFARRVKVPRCKGIIVYSACGDWRQPYMDILQHFITKHSNMMKIKRKSSRFFIEEGHLFRRGFNRHLSDASHAMK